MMQLSPLETISQVRDAIVVVFARGPLVSGASHAKIFVSVVFDPLGESDAMGFRRSRSMISL